MTTETAHEIARQKLLQGLLDAVKQCQRRYGGKSELATESNSSVSVLLSRFEATFQHGLKKGKVWGAINSLSEPFRQVTGSLLSNLPEGEPTCWPFIRDHLGNLEVQRFLSLRHVTTDQGRARSFIRSCLNEHTLERHVTTFLADHSIIRQYYEDWALLLDDEKVSTLPSMARGLAPIFFAVEIDHPSLNDPVAQSSTIQPFKASKTKTTYDEPLPVIAGQPETSGNGGVSQATTRIGRKKKKRKVNTVDVSNLEYDGSFDDPAMGESSSGSLQSSLTSEQTLSNDVLSSISNVPYSGSGGTIPKRKDRTLPENSFETPQRKPSEDLSLIERVASLGTSFKRSLSVTSQDLDTFPQTTENVDTTNVDDLERNLDQQLYEFPGASPEVSFQFEKQRSSYDTLVSDTFNTDLYSNALLLKRNGADQQSAFDLQTDVKVKIERHEDVNRTDEKDIGLAGTSTIKEDHVSHYSTAGRKVNGHEAIPESSNQGTKIKHSDFVNININSRLKATEKERSSGDLLNVILGSGEQLSVSEGAFEKLMLEKELRTPPSTPEPDNHAVSRINGKNTNKHVPSSHNGLKDLDKLMKAKLADRYEDELSDAFAPPLNALNGNNAAQGWEIVDRDSQSGSEKSRDCDVEDVQSIASSTTENDSVDILQPVGYDSTKFHDLIMTYDMESTKAATDTLALLNQSNKIGPVFDSQLDNENSVQGTVTNNVKTVGADSSSGFVDNLSVADLKQAVLSTAKRRDHLEQQYRDLQTALDEEKEYGLMLKGEVDRYQDQLTEVQEKSQQKIHDLSRENNVLRNQLKKYVAAVQLLRRDKQNLSVETNKAISTLRGLKEDSDVVLPPEPKERSPSESDSIFEEKLAQIAEMHGELLEFNEHLQRQLIHRETQVSKMREELVSLRGPLPQDLDVSSASSDDVSASGGKPLINIWIPSVFMKGKGSDAYHVYQILTEQTKRSIRKISPWRIKVYIRIGDEEWNIYRRYSQFFKLHSRASKQFPVLSSFSFPPKKFIGKKDLKFVEGRRRRLQEYLRKLINLTLASNDILSTLPNKQNLVQVESFFGEPYSEDEKKSGSVKSKKKSAPTLYTGL